MFPRTDGLSRCMFAYIFETEFLYNLKQDINIVYATTIIRDAQNGHLYKERDYMQMGYGG